MIEEILLDAEDRMDKSLASLDSAFNKIRTGRAHPSILGGIRIDYYGAETPLKQMASINVEDARTLAVSVFDKSITPDVEKAIISKRHTKIKRYLIVFFSTLTFISAT